MKKCPFCAEDIQDAAIVCRFCRSDVSAIASNGTATESKPAKSSLKRVAIVIASLIGVVLLGLVGLMVLGTLLASDLSTSRSTSPSLVVLLYKGLRGLRITNDTDQPWNYCVAELTGSYTARVHELKPRETIELYYTEFAVAGTPLNEADGYARAIRSTSFTCTGRDDRRYEAITR